MRFLRNLISKPTFDYPDREALAEDVLKRVGNHLGDHVPPVTVIAAIGQAVEELYDPETYRPTTYASDPSPRSKENFEIVRETLFKFALTFFEQVPQNLLRLRNTFDQQIDEEPTQTLPLLDFLGDVRPFVQELIYLFYTDEIESRDIFPMVRALLDDNLHRLSGIPTGQITKKQQERLIVPTDFDGTPEETVNAYLQHTPLIIPFMAPVAFEIPAETRFAGHWIIAPPGRGKTTLLHHLFLEDIKQHASIIVMDSKGDLIGPIKRLKGISERLVIIEPDEDYPLALNPLDIPKSNIVHTIALLEYVFSALLEAKMTALQSTLFRYVLPAIVQTVPNPTLMDFRNVIENGLGNYAANFDKLKPLERKFFEEQFDSKTYSDTRNQLIWRLDFLLTNPLMRAMFEAPKTKIDIGKEMDAGKIILINNSKELLGEDGAEFFGRFFISLVLSAAQQRSSRRPEDKLPCYFYIDECQSVIKRDTKIATILDETRSQRIGLVLAHQRTEQIQDKNVLSALMNCAIRYANSDDEAKTLADSLRTTPEFLRSLPRGTFAAYIRDLTQNAISLKIPYTNLSKLPQLAPDEQLALRRRTREEFCFVPDTHDHIETPHVDSAEPSDKW